jgi:uncharacterized membrane protein
MRLEALSALDVLSSCNVSPLAPGSRPTCTPLDEYPFPLLATILAPEAVLLTSCVLIRQNLIDKTLERRDHLELQINLLAEREATRSLRILQKIAEHLAVRDIEDCKEDELARETSVDQIAQI